MSSAAFEQPAEGGHKMDDLWQRQQKTVWVQSEREEREERGSPAWRCSKKKRKNLEQNSINGPFPVDPACARGRRPAGRDGASESEVASAGCGARFGRRELSMSEGKEEREREKEESGTHRLCCMFSPTGVASPRAPRANPAGQKGPILMGKALDVLARWMRRGKRRIEKSTAHAVLALKLFRHSFC